VVSRMETPDHWITYCEATEGNVANADKKTAVHRRKVSSLQSVVFFGWHPAQWRERV